MRRKIICFCNMITESMIEKTIVKHSITAVSEITMILGAGGSCGKCKNSIESILNTTLEKSPTVQTKIPWTK